MENIYITEQIKRGGKLIRQRQYDEALNVYEMIDKRSASDTQKATIANDIALIYKHKGWYKAAEKRYMEAILFYEHNDGEPLRDYLTTLNNLAITKMYLGNYSDAKHLKKFVLEKTEENIGKQTAFYALGLNNLSTFHYSTGLYSEAEILQREARQLRACLIGRESILYIQSTVGLARCCMKLKRSGEAIELFEEGLTLMRSINFTNNPHYNKAVLNLSTLLMQNGENEKAERLLQDEMANLTADVRETTVFYAMFLIEYSKLLMKMCQNQEAFDKLIEARQIVERQTGKRSLLYTEILSCMAEVKLSEKHSEEAYEHLVEAVDVQNNIFINTTFEYEEQKALDFLRHIDHGYCQLIDLLRRSFKDDSAKVREVYLKILLRKNIILEMTILQNVLLKRYENPETPYSHIDMKEKLKRIDYTTLLNKLEKGSVLLDIYYLDDVNRYVMFVINSDHDIQLIDLGKTSDLNQLIAQYRKHLWDSEQNGSLELLSLGLYMRFFSFLKGHLPHKLIISPTNAISQLSFETLQTPKGTYLIEETTIQYITSVKDISEETIEKIPEKTMTLLSDPDFDYPSNQAQDETKHMKLYKRLPGTQGSEKAIKKTLKGWKITHQLTGKAANLLNVKNIKGNRIIHIATHGFFRKANENTNPMKESGVVLAGINSVLRGLELSEKEAMEIGNGELSAYDLTLMDLKGTDLIILSACETGLGEIVPGNGVLGLQRAVLLSGIRQMIMTLWPVPDDASFELMSLFYKHYAKDGEVEQALRRAKLEMIEKYRRKYGHAAPILWGGYVCLSRNL